MLLGILDLEEVTIEDIMMPRSEIYGIDLTDEWIDIVEQLTTSGLAVFLATLAISIISKAFFI